MPGGGQDLEERLHLVGVPVDPLPGGAAAPSVTAALRWNPIAPSGGAPEGNQHHNSTKGAEDN